jgi:flagellar biogenesis protein FliO
MRHTILAAMACGFLAIVPVASAQDGKGETADVASFPSPTVAPLVRLALAVAGISAAGWGLTVWARRRHVTRGGENARIQVLASRNLGPRHQIALLEVGDHRLLIGMGGDSIATLADLSGGIPFGDELEKRFPQPTEEGRRTFVDMIGHFEGLDG